VRREHRQRFDPELLKLRAAIPAGIWVSTSGVCCEKPLTDSDGQLVLLQSQRTRVIPVNAENQNFDHD